MHIMYEHVLIDGKNMLYRAIFTAEGDSNFKKSGHHTINIILHFLKYYFNKFNPKEIHVFWDTKRENTWRRDIDPKYKDNRKNTQRPGVDIDSALIELTEVCAMLFKYMGIKQYYRDKMEADDLIYAFCRMNPKKKILIISSDSDLKQISFRHNNVDVHNPLSKHGKLVEDIPESDPVLIKSFMGDKSDNIDGYHMVGKVKAKILAEDVVARNNFFNSDKCKINVDNEKIIVGYKRFEDNLRMIDLSLCPHLLDNMMYILNKQFKLAKFDLTIIREIISKYKLRGVSTSITRYIAPFKELVEDTNGSSN